MYPFSRSLTGIFCLVLSLSYGCWQTNAAAAHTLAHRAIAASDVDDARWTVKATPDGPDLRLNGTIEQIYSQLLRINPNYDRDWNISIPTIRDERDADRIAAEIAAELDLVRSKARHHKRSWVDSLPEEGFFDNDDAGWLAFWTDTFLNTQCTKIWAKKKAILMGRLHLMSIARGRPRLDPLTQKSCSRVSCSEDSGIIWCVDGREPGYVKGFKPVELDSYNEIGNAAMALFTDCNHESYISGRLFTRDNWYIVVERQKC